MAKYRIMVVDDDDDARKMLGLALRQRYEVVEATDGLDALSKLETFEPDFAILDIMMPLMDGYQVCEAIRKHPRFKTMQVMFLSAFGSKENIKKGYAVGTNLFMTKPVDPERVLKNIDFTIQHEPPPMRVKKYTIEQLQKLDSEQQAQRKHQAPAAAEPTPPPPAAAPAAAPPREPSVGSARGPVVPGTQPVESATVRHGIRPRILVVDDDHELLQMVDLALRDDYEITTATNGLEAIEHMVDFEPDLMLLDIMMPKMNGYQLLQSIRRNAYFRNLPVIVISAKSTPRDREYAARLGATHFIAKPYAIDELLGTLVSVTTSPDFKISPKTATINEIRDRVYAEARERQERLQEINRRRKFAEMQDVIDEAISPKKAE